MENPNQRPRILIVDASRMARATLISQIREQYNFREEVNGESGWQALVIDHSIQLVICALSMPMLDGDGLLARVRSSRLTRLRQMPVLMIAGDNEEANERARVLGASDFISRGIGAANCSPVLPRCCSWHRRRTSCARARNVTLNTRSPDYRLADTSKCRRHRPCRRPSGTMAR